MMKTNLMLILCLGLCGCEKPVPVKATYKIVTGDGPTIKINEGTGETWALKVSMDATVEPVHFMRAWVPIPTLQDEKALRKLNEGVRIYLWCRNNPQGGRIPEFNEEVTKEKRDKLLISTQEFLTRSLGNSFYEADMTQ